MKKCYLFAVIFAGITVISFICVFLLKKNEETAAKAFVFSCPDGKSIEARFIVNKDRSYGSVILKLSDGRKMTLPQTISASGARYATASEDIVFWNKGDSAFITENGNNTYNDCWIK